MSDNDFKIGYSLTPFEAVEIGKIDLIRNGTLIWREPTTKKWETICTNAFLAILVELNSLAILGYHLYWKNNEFSQAVQIATKNAISPRYPREVRTPNLAYRHGSGFPSWVLEKYTWALWDKFFISKTYKSNVEVFTPFLYNVVQCKFHEIPCVSRVVDSVIMLFLEIIEVFLFNQLNFVQGEMFFGYINHRFSWLDPFMFDYLMDIIDVSCAEYNATKIYFLDDKSPLDILKKYSMSKNFKVRKVPKTIRNIFE